MCSAVQFSIIQFNLVQLRIIQCNVVQLSKGTAQAGAGSTTGFSPKKLHCTGHKGGGECSLCTVQCVVCIM